MRKTVAPVTLLALSLIAFEAEALDRNSTIIDTLAVEVGGYDNGDFLVATLNGETAIADPDLDWAILLGGGFGQWSADNAADIDFWQFSVGMKFYLTTVTSMSIVGRYTSYDAPVDDPSTMEGIFTFKQRLAVSEAAISPYLAGSVSLRDSEWDPDSVTSESFTELVAGVTAGCDLMLTETMAVVLEGTYTFPQEISGGAESPDTWIGVFGMKGHWD